MRSRLFKNELFDKDVLFSDLDGTLLIGDEKNLTISEGNQIAIKEWVEKGNFFSIATGRTILQAKRILKDLVPINLPLVLANGAVIYDAEKDEIIYQSDLDNEIITEVLEALKSRNDTIIILTDPYKYYAILPDDKTNIPELYFECEITEYNKISNLSFVKILIYTKEESVTEVMKILKKLPRTKIAKLFQSSNTFIEIVNKGTNKGSAIRKILKKREYPYDYLYTIGDYHNDIEMLKMADVSAAPQNAHMDVKLIADNVIKNYDEDAVAYFISKIYVTINL